jgi:osmoprotectant transport system permease protein
MTALPQRVSQAHEFVTWFTTRSSWTGTGGVVQRLGQHLWISAIALSIAVAIGLGLSVLLARFRRGGLVVTIVGNAARSIPIVGILVILALGPLGVGSKSAILALIIFAIPPVLTNAFTGIQTVEPDVIAAAVGLGMSNRQLTRRVRLPLAIPLIATGIRLAAVQVWATATIAAIVGSGGLGQLVTTGYGSQNYGEVYGGTVVIIVTALAVDYGLSRAQRAVRVRFGDVSGAALAT